MGDSQGFRLDTFLGCAKLETGGRFIGALNLVASTLLLIVSAVAFGGFFSTRLESPFFVRRDYAERDDLNSIAEELLIDVASMKYTEDVLLNLLISFVSVWMSFFGVYLSYRLLDGITKRSSADVKPFMIVSFCSAVFPLSLLLFGVLGASVQLIVVLYCSIIVYSLWRKFIEEEEKCLPTTTAPTMSAPTVSVNLRHDEMIANHFTNKISPNNNSYYPNPPPSYNV